MNWTERVRKFKANMLRRDISKPPIAIFAARRGGSTMLADVIACNRGVWFADEPFAVFPYHPGYDLKKRLLPEREHSQYFDLDDHELDAFAGYVDGLLGAKFAELGTCRRAKGPLLADRVCLKILNTPWMLDWFITQTNCDAIFLTRHPASQAISVLRQGWDFSVKAYFNRPDALTRYFSDEQISFGFDLLQRGEPWEVAILDWIVINWPGLTSTRSSLIRARYEELIANPEPFAEKVLHQRLGLVELDRMIATFNVPSNSSSLSNGVTRDAILAGNKEHLLSAWQQKIGEDEVRTAQRILDKFEVVDYNMQDPMPVARTG